jgi:hypothetical protein
VWRLIPAAAKALQIMFRGYEQAEKRPWFPVSQKQIEKMHAEAAARRDADDRCSFWQNGHRCTNARVRPGERCSGTHSFVR